MGKKVVIIGAGYIGLTAAFRLLKEGFAVEVYEKESYLGGLASGIEFENTRIERLYHHIFKTDTDFLNLSKELGIYEKFQWLDSSISVYYDKQLYPFVTPQDLLKFKPLSLVNRVRAGVVVLFLQKYRNWQALKNRPAYEWMRRWAGKQVTSVIWEPLLKGKFDKYFDKVAMSWLWARIHVRANSRENLESEKLGYLMGGFDLFTKVLAEKIKELGGKIYLNSEVEEIVSEKDGVSVRTKSSTIKGDLCLVTISSDNFSRIIKTSLQEYKNELSSINYLGALCMLFTSSQDISPFYWHNINDLDMPFLVFINHTKLIDRSNYNNKYVYYVAAYLPEDHELYKSADEEIFAIWTSGIKKIFPKFEKNKIQEYQIFRFNKAQHIVEVDFDNKIPDHQTPLKNVYLYNFSQIYPEDRGINYAIREGNKAAEQLSKASSTTS